jgi:uncharacterized protein YeaO (DUF488 family)
VAEGSYYSRRSARDPAWREQARAASAERCRRALERDPEHVRDFSRRYRARLREQALTFTQLREAAQVAHSDADEATLARVLPESLSALSDDLGRRISDYRDKARVTPGL